MNTENTVPTQAQPIPAFKDMVMEGKFQVSSLTLLLQVAQNNPKPEASFMELANAFQQIGFALQQAQNAYNKLVEEQKAEVAAEAKEVSNSN